MSDDCDVVVTDGFTGNVVLKTLEGAMRQVMSALTEAVTANAELAEHAARCCLKFFPCKHRWRQRPTAAQCCSEPMVSASSRMVVVADGDQ